MQRFLVGLTGSTAVSLVVSFMFSSFSGSVVSATSPLLSSVMYRNVPLLPSFGEAGGDEDSRRWVKAAWPVWDGKCSRRSCSTSGIGVMVISLKVVAGWGWGSDKPEQGGWAGLEVSGSEQLSSDEKWLQCESATEGRLPLRDGESNSEELVLRCSNSWASISPLVSLIFVSPLLLAFFHSFPLLFLPPEVEGSFDQGGEGQRWLSCCAQQQVEGHEHWHVPPLTPLRPAELLLQLASSRLLLALQCLTFSCLDSTSAWTSRLLSLSRGM